MIGAKRWAIADGYIPEGSHGPEPEMDSHGTVSILNTADEDVDVELTIYYADRDPAGPYEIAVGGERTKHVRFNDLEEPESVPRATPFAAVIEADGPIVCQHTRLDSRQAENALLSTMAHPGD
ncbi:sensory rhodopsin transducer [Natronobiforma cellulositropha]|uniref:sensory rhodopsin transducer n=1 Tax=Natronobiforma cellulositropha TaxID=1679076 RepID=UPI0021D60582|nr:sensory rhodopsin transducer [Natronobiforma cellulositropha]